MSITLPLRRAAGTAGPSPDYATADGPRAGIVRAALGLTYFGAATMPWTAVGVAGISIGEIAIFLAAALFVLADFKRVTLSLPPWVWVFVVTVGIIGVVNQIAPPSLEYVAHRNNPIFGSYSGGSSSTFLVSNLAVMVNLLARLLVLPLVFGFARRQDSNALYRSAMAFVGGAAFSALIAFSDSRGFTSFGPSLVGVDVIDQRASGLTDHPNVVALGCVFALPLAFWRLRLVEKRRRFVMVVVLVALALGLFASRSRAGAGAAVFAGAVALFWLPQFRRILPTIGLLLGLLGAVIFVANPGLGTALLTGLRLDGGDTTDSDQARDIVNDQALRDFLHSPVHGIGLEIAGVAHVVYLQALAVGGLILLTGFIVYLIGALVRSARLARVEPLAIPLFISVLGAALFNAAQDVFTPAVVYLVPSLVAALPLSRAISAHDDRDP